ncbi:MAG: RecQ family ATP-dependent DNA helicase [Flavobacteriaceae bacterium]|nr:RecQ family ATP-dependent DNA helicase [Flavobacteriaceae bacterium]
MKEPIQILETYWGYHQFLPRQEEIISTALEGRDIVALLPTGGGKSVCFQLPTLAKEGICIVISPLVALMTDQVNSLKKKGIKALSIPGGISYQDLNALLDNALYGTYKFLYLSPERLQQELVQNCIKAMNVNLIAIDEAHCISQWGNDFRPTYKNCNILRTILPLVPMIALTASATPEVLADIVLQLKLKTPAIIKSSFVRKNLSYQVHYQEDKLYRIEQLLKKSNGSAIIYVRSRKNTVEISQQLNSLGISSHFFHGGISSEDKNTRLEEWLQGKKQVMVATNAFGMGIDNPNVSYVFHTQLPESMESYFQEAGRAGRDVNYSSAMILYNDYDKILIKKQFLDSRPTTHQLKTIYRSLSNYFKISYGEGAFSTNSFNYVAFCKHYQLNTLFTYNGLTALERLGIIKLSKQFGRRSILKFKISSDKLISYLEQNPTISLIGKTILRMCGGIFESETYVKIELIASKTRQSVVMVINALEKMEQEGILDLKLFHTDASITFLVPREDDKTINSVSKALKALNHKKESEVNAVLHYINNDAICKSLQLVGYFGEKSAENCGICSVCASQKSSPSKKEIQFISEKILLLLEERELSSRILSEKLTFTESKIVIVLRHLQDVEKIRVNTKNEYFLN